MLKDKYKPWRGLSTYDRKINQSESPKMPRHLIYYFSSKMKKNNAKEMIEPGLVGHTYNAVTTKPLRHSWTHIQESLSM